MLGIFDCSGVFDLRPPQFRPRTRTTPTPIYLEVRLRGGPGKLDQGCRFHSFPEVAGAGGRADGHHQPADQHGRVHGLTPTDYV